MSGRGWCALARAVAVPGTPWSLTVLRDGRRVASTYCGCDGGPHDLPYRRADGAPRWCRGRYGAPHRGCPTCFGWRIAEGWEGDAPGNTCSCPEHAGVRRDLTDA